MPSTSWLSSDAFADAAGISVQAARRALRAAVQGSPWRGTALKVRRTLGRGGRSGLTYEVALDSLAAALRMSLPAPSSEKAPLPPVRSGSQDARVLARLEIIEIALAEPRGSSARAEAVQLASHATGVSTRTSWEPEHTGGGMNSSLDGTGTES